MILYCILNAENGKRYIGLTTVGLAKRWMQHVWTANHGNQRPLYRAIRKYGPDAFVVEEVASLMPGHDVDELRELERDLIEQEGAMSPGGYNLTAGGEGMFGCNFSEESRAKIAALNASPERREKLRAAWTPERRQKQSESNHRLHLGRPSPKKGKALSPEHRAKLSVAQTARFKREKPAWAGVKGRVLSPEHRAAISRGNTGKRMSPEARAKIAAANNGFKPGLVPHNKGGRLPEEHKAKLRAAWTPERKAEWSARNHTLSERARAKITSLNRDPARRALVKASWTPERKAKHSTMMRQRHALARASRTQQEELH